MNKKTVLAATTAMLVVTACSNPGDGASQAEQEPERQPEPLSAENPRATIPAIDAYYEGGKLWFIHTDVSDEPMAQMLTMMVGYRTIHSSRLGDVPIDNVGKFYAFTNGIMQEGVKPWGGGPFGYQIDIFDSVPGDDGYTPLRNPQLVTWLEAATPRILTSVAELLEAEANGELSIKPTGVIVSAPVVRWPTDYLGGQSRIEP